MYSTISKNVHLNGLDRILDKELGYNGLHVFSTAYMPGEGISPDSLDNTSMLLNSYGSICKFDFSQEKFDTSKFPSKRYYMWSFADESISYGLLKSIPFMFDMFKSDVLSEDCENRLGIRFYSTFGEEKLPLFYKDSGESFQEFESYFLPIFDAALRLLE